MKTSRIGHEGYWLQTSSKINLNDFKLRVC
jgi:hypothetical protein